MIVVQSKAGEYFGINTSRKEFDEMPEDAKVLVHQFCPFYSDGIPEIRLVSGRRFFKGYLTPTGEEELTTLDLGETETIFHLSEEEFIMSTKRLISLANEGKLEECEASLSRSCFRAVTAALRSAEKHNEFEAMAGLSDLLTRYEAPDGKQVVKLTEKDAKALTIKHTDKVPAGVWDAIVAKVKKIGDIVKSDKTSASVLIRKTEAEAFAKAASKIAGISVEG